MTMTSDRARRRGRQNWWRQPAAVAALVSLALLAAACGGSNADQLDTAAGAPTSTAEAEIPLSNVAPSDAATPPPQEPAALPTPLPDSAAGTETDGQDAAETDSDAQPTPASGGAGTPSNDAFLAEEPPAFWNVTGDGPVNARLTPGLSGEIVGTFQPGDDPLASTGRRAMVDDIEWKELAAGDELPIVWTAAAFLKPDSAGQAPGAEPTSPPAQGTGLDGLVIASDEVVRFGAGGTSSTVSKAVIRGERDRYRLEARRGQTLNLEITSLEDNAVFSVFDANEVQLVEEKMTASIVLPATGEYTIIVGATRGNASYKLTVAIPA